MAGESNYGGNGSIYWTVYHRSGGRLEIKDGTDGWDRVTNAGNSAMNKKAWTPALEAGEWVDVSGVHPGQLKGRDRGAAAMFEVGLRFDTSPDGIVPSNPERRAAIVRILQKLAQDAQAALTKINNGANAEVVTVQVPVINRPQTPANQWEVSVLWK